MDEHTVTAVGLENAGARSVRVSIGAGAVRNSSTMRLLSQLAPALVRSLRVEPHAGLTTLSSFDGAELDELTVCDRGAPLPSVALRPGARVEVWYPDVSIQPLLRWDLAEVILRAGRLSRLELQATERLYLGHCKRLTQLAGRVSHVESNMCTRLRLGPECEGLASLRIVGGLGMPLEDLTSLEALVRIEFLGVPRLAAVDVAAFSALGQLEHVLLDAKDSTVRRWSEELPHVLFSNSMGVWRRGVRQVDAHHAEEARRLRAWP